MTNTESATHELLVLAAKAAGLIVQKNTACVDADDRFIGIRVRANERDRYARWNPLADDGEALRLAAILRLTIKPGKHPGDGCTVDSQRAGVTGCTVFRDEPAEQMRRAIVMVAAEIGQLVRSADLPIPKPQGTTMSQPQMTAAEAAALARSKSPEGAVEKILAEVRKQAEAGKTSLKTYSCGFGDGALYTDESKFPELQREVLKRLRELGYSAEVRVEERQFVDLWLNVSWAGAHELPESST